LQCSTRLLGTIEGLKLETNHSKSMLVEKQGKIDLTLKEQPVPECGCQHVYNGCSMMGISLASKVHQSRGFRTGNFVQELNDVKF
jgi:hypothetical protein